MAAETRDDVRVLRSLDVYASDSVLTLQDVLQGADPGPGTVPRLVDVPGGSDVCVCVCVWCVSVCVWCVHVRVRGVWCVCVCVVCVYEARNLSSRLGGISCRLSVNFS